MKSIMRVLYQFVEEQNIEKNYLDSEHEKYQEAAYNQFEKNREGISTAIGAVGSVCQ